jgi:hypothetical protein
MTFGKYKGQLIQDVPKDYLEWAVSKIVDMDPALKHAIRLDLTRRARPGARPPPSAEAPSEQTVLAKTRESLDQIVGRWYRQASRRYHPDCGGTADQMIVVNGCREFLEREIAKLSDDAPTPF